MKRSARALVGYMQREDAIRLLSQGAAQPSEDQTKRADTTWRKLASNVERRPSFVVTDPVRDIPSELKQFMDDFAARPDVRSVMQPFDWEMGMVELSAGVLSMQTLVFTDDVATRLRLVSRDDLFSVASVCLPPPSAVTLQVGYDQSQSALTAASMNPNLRIGGFGTFDTMTPAGQPQKVFGFHLALGVSFVQVAHYQGRWMLRDGYHRVFGLTRLGVWKIPCVIIRARRFEETGAGRPGLFDYERLFGEHPPQIPDYLSDDFSADVQIQAQMKVVRIRAEEYFVPIYRPGEDAEEN